MHQRDWEVVEGLKLLLMAPVCGALLLWAVAVCVAGWLWWCVKGRREE